MCGRYALTLPVEAMARLFGAVPANDLPPTPNYNICPTNQVPVVMHEDQRRLVSMRWGFIPFWYKTPQDGPLLINARAETLADKPAFRSAARERRCLLPASGFYEWQKGEGGKRLPWYACRRDGAPMALAGIWQRWHPPHAADGEPQTGEALTTCLIVTADANHELAPIHDRMPVVLSPDQWGLWLGEEGKGAAALMRPAPEGALCTYRVSTEVNSSRASGPRLIEAIDDRATDMSRTQ